MLLREPDRRFLTREVLTFLAVGGAGYVVDVAAFNLLRSLEPSAPSTRRWHAPWPSRWPCA